MSTSLLFTIILLATASGPSRGTDTLACVQDSASQHQLERVVRKDFLLSSSWAATRRRWGWHAAAADVSAVTDPAVCMQASRAIAAARRSRNPYRPILLVRAGNLYVASPPDSGDEWIFLDRQWHVVEHVIVPS
jgi:hypothetical protein